MYSISVRLGTYSLEYEVRVRSVHSFRPSGIGNDMFEVKLSNARRLLLFFGATAIFLTPLFVLSAEWVGFEDTRDVGALVFFLIGFGLALMFANFLLSKVYEVSTFHLYGWNGGRYGVKLRVHLHERGMAVLSPHTHEIIDLGDLARSYPRAPHWDPVVGKSNQVMLLNSVFRLTK